MRGPALDRLAALAQLRALRAARRLAPHQAEADALRARIAGLREALPAGSPGDVAEAVLRDRHMLWRQSQLVRLTQDLARAEAQAQPLREAQALERGREAVIARLGGRAHRDQFD